MKKRLYVIIAIICLCVVIIAIMGTLYLINRKKVNSDDTEVVSANSITEENNDTTSNIDNERNIENIISENVISGNKNNTQIVLSTTNDKVTNKNNNSKTSERILDETNVNDTAVKESTSNNSNKVNTEKKEQENQDNQDNSSKDDEKLQEVQLNLEKYDRYEKALNGGYTCFKKNATEIKKLKNLINQAIEDFGYTDVQIKEDSSIVSNRYFTANKTNVENMVYDSEGFTIYYYAETEYGLTKDGRETVFQVRSYIKVK